jgi:P-type Cu+ transporter
LKPIDLHIEGMTCAACSARIEKVLNKIPGAHAEVSLLEHRARITGLDAEQAIAAVRRAGYDAWPVATNSQDSRAHIRPLSLHDTLRLWISVAALLPMLAEMTAMVLGHHGLIPVSVQLPLALVMQTYVAWPFYQSAWRALQARTANMETLVSMGTLAAFGWSVSMLSAADPVFYFETSIVVIAMVRIGRHLEQRAARQALDALEKLIHLEQSNVLALSAQSGQWVETRCTEVLPGTRIQIEHNQMIPLDAVIDSGHSEIDESSLTGESVPVAKGPGEKIYAGCVNLSGAITATVAAPFSQSRRSQIGEKILSALSSRPAISQLVDRIAAVFVPTVLVIALAALAGHLILGHLPAAALSAAVAVLVVACPCALGLATPAAIAAGMARAAQQGWLFSNAQALQQASEITEIVFDKTGTLTSGRPQVVALQDSEGSALGDWPNWLGSAAAAERGVEHPLAGALLSYAAGRPMPVCTGATPIPGLGIQATVAQTESSPATTIHVGKPSWIAQQALDTPQLDDLYPEASAVDVALNGQWKGRLWVADALRPDALEAIALLQKHGLAPRVLSGDRGPAVARISKALGGLNALAEKTPEQKSAELDSLKREGKKVAMVGDGINDAAAMAHAHLGIAMASGANLALKTADLTIASQNPLRATANSLLLARAVMRRVKENLLFAFSFNILAIPLAATGLLSPTIAGAAMGLSSAAVVANSTRLLRWKPY